ncbi:MAG: hypothetical protein IK015_04275 [Treponema sp.]|nr:hypothetical protein [Treponema sp.]
MAKSSKTLVHPKTPPHARNIFALANIGGQAKMLRERWSEPLMNDLRRFDAPQQYQKK